MEPENNLTLAEILGLEGRCQEFLLRIHNIDFDELLQLAKDAGFPIGKPDGTSHQISKHPTHAGGPPAYDKMNFQNAKGKAKPYQVRQLVGFIRTAQKKKAKQ
jgi:hypothetical protein